MTFLFLFFDGIDGVDQVSYPDASFMCVHDCNVSNVSFFFLGAVTFKKRKKRARLFLGGVGKNQQSNDATFIAYHG